VVSRQAGKRVLLIDVGNSNMKWSWWDESRSLSVKMLRHRGLPADELASRAFADEAAPSRIVLASVAAEGLAAGLDRWMAEHWQLNAQRVKASSKACGVTNGYIEPQQLGVDRWLTLIAARQLGKTPACIVDCGTAITVDVIDGEGRHRGGLILPGFDLMRDALLADTCIPRIGTADATSLLARDTRTGVAAAALHAASALVERIMRSLQDEGGGFRLLLTGSDAERLQAGLGIPAEIERNLVMLGLAQLADSEEWT
jgi:type III pantothenate kinase